MAKICTDIDCTNVQPCVDHKRSPYATSKRRSRTVSGWVQQKRAKFVMLRDLTICHVCGYAGSDEVDHVMPLAEGGRDHVSNLAPIHRSCHRAKTEEESRRARR